LSWLDGTAVGKEVYIAICRRRCLGFISADYLKPERKGLNLVIRRLKAVSMSVPELRFAYQAVLPEHYLQVVHTHVVHLHRLKSAVDPVVEVKIGHPVRTLVGLELGSSAS